MAEKTFIEWTDSTWNPWMGCTKVSPGCQNCYAERWAKQYSRPFHRLGFAAESGRNAPLRWKKPRRVFVCSLSDFFHPDVFEDARLAAMQVMAAAPQHTYQILTKRPELIKPFLAGTPWEQGLPDNVWLGVTAENQGTADVRIPLLLSVKARVRFVSCEPMLGPVTFEKRHFVIEEPLNRSTMSVRLGLHWVICGGESGQEARPMHPEWARSLRDQCAAAGVPFFFKQWGEWAPEGAFDSEKMMKENNGIVTTPKGGLNWHAVDGGYPTGGISGVFRVGKKAAGRLLDGHEHLEIPKGDK